MKNIFLPIIALSLFLTCSCRTHHTPDLQDGNVPQITIQNNSLAEIFSKSNQKLLRNIPQNGDTVIVIRSETELMNICPDNVEVPSIDFSKNCIVYASVTTASISDELVSNKLYYSKDSKTYIFDVCIQHCIECFAAIGHVYPYGIYKISPTSINDIELKVSPYLSPLYGTWELNDYVYYSNEKDITTIQTITPSHQGKSVSFESSDAMGLDLLTLRYVNTLCIYCYANQDGHITFTDGWDKWAGTEIYDCTGNEDKLTTFLLSMDSWVIHNDVLYLINSQSSDDYNALRLNRMAPITSIPNNPDTEI